MAESADEAPAEETESPAEAKSPPKTPFELRSGSRVEFGPRKGKVAIVRGGGKVPYDVQVCWDGEKYPLWYIYRTLEMFHERGEFRVV